MTGAGTEAEAGAAQSRAEPSDTLDTLSSTAGWLSEETNTHCDMSWDATAVHRSKQIQPGSITHPQTLHSYQPHSPNHPRISRREMSRRVKRSSGAAVAASTPTLAQMAAQMERLERSNQLQQEAIVSLTRTIERLAPMAMMQQQPQIHMQQSPQMWQTPVQQPQPYPAGGSSVSGSTTRYGPALQTPVQSRTDFSASASPATAEAATATRLTPRQIARQSAADRTRLLKEFKAEHERKLSRKKKRAPSRSRSPTRSATTGRRSSSSKARVSTLFQPTEASARRTAGVSRPASPRRDTQPDGASTARSSSSASSSHASRIGTPRSGVEPGDTSHRSSRNQSAFPPPPDTAATREQETEMWGRVEGAAPRLIEAWSQTEHPSSHRPHRSGTLHPAAQAAYRSPMHVHSVSFKRPPLSLHVDDSDRLTARSVGSSTR